MSGKRGRKRGRGEEGGMTRKSNGEGVKVRATRTGGGAGDNGGGKQDGMDVI